MEFVETVFNLINKAPHKTCHHSISDQVALWLLMVFYVISLNLQIHLKVISHWRVSLSESISISFPSGTTFTSCKFSLYIEKCCVSIYYFNSTRNWPGWHVPRLNYLPSICMLHPLSISLLAFVVIFNYSPLSPYSDLGSFPNEHQF